MSVAAGVLGEFAAALLDPEYPPPAGLVTRNSANPATRFAVYCNNVTVSLVAALADTFPVTRELVGRQFFDAMARCFIVAQPPRSPVLTEYGDDFPDFVASFDPARALAHLPDVPRLEVARVRAYHAAEAEVLATAALAALLADHDRLPCVRLTLQPSFAVVASDYAVVSLWAAHHGEGQLDAVDPARPESASPPATHLRLRLMNTQGSPLPKPRPSRWAAATRWIDAAELTLSRIAEDLIALLGRFSIAGVFWKSGQTKVEGYAIDLVDGSFALGWPRLSESAVALFGEEHRLPVVQPELAAGLAALGEHILPVLVLLGLGTRFAALGLLAMTAVIRFLVYAGAYPTHGVWAAVLLWLMVRGAGRLSVDHLIGQRMRNRARVPQALGVERMES